MFIFIGFAVIIASLLVSFHLSDLVSPSRLLGSGNGNFGKNTSGFQRLGENDQQTQSPYEEGQ